MDLDRRVASAGSKSFVCIEPPRASRGQFLQIMLPLVFHPAWRIPRPQMSATGLADGYLGLAKTVDRFGQGVVIAVAKAAVVAP